MIEKDLPRRKSLAFAARGYPVLPLYGIVRRDKNFGAVAATPCAQAPVSTRTRALRRTDSRTLLPIPNLSANGSTNIRR
jgi:hypothetical protein